VEFILWVVLDIELRCLMLYTELHPQLPKSFCLFVWFWGLWGQGLEFELGASCLQSRHYRLSQTSSSFFCVFFCFFKIGPLKLFASGWPQTVIFPMSASQVARITGMSHQHPTFLGFLVFGFFEIGSCCVTRASLKLKVLQLSLRVLGYRCVPLCPLESYILKQWLLCSLLYLFR
jgi:hypothetical protein